MVGRLGLFELVTSRLISRSSFSWNFTWLMMMMMMISPLMLLVFNALVNAFSLVLLFSNVKFCYNLMKVFLSLSWVNHQDSECI